MSFQCDEQAVHVVLCTVCSMWTKHKLPRNDTVHLCMGTSPDCHFWSTARCIPVGLKCPFVIEDAELSVTGLPAFVQRFVTGPIHQTAGMVDVEERYQPPMQSLHNGRYCGKPAFGVWTTYIVPFGRILIAGHLLLLRPQQDSMRWYLSNMIYLNAFNLCYMYIIRFDVWSNHCCDGSKSDECLLWVSSSLWWELYKLLYNRCHKGLNSYEYSLNQSNSSINCWND